MAQGFGQVSSVRLERSAITLPPRRSAYFARLPEHSKQTGVSIWTHTTHFGELALEQIALLREEGVSPERIVISHLGDRFGAHHFRKIAEQGVFLGIDNIGYKGDGYPADEVRARNVAELIQEGF